MDTTTHNETTNLNEKGKKLKQQNYLKWNFNNTIPLTHHVSLEINSVWDFE